MIEKPPALSISPSEQKPVTPAVHANAVADLLAPTLGRLADLARAETVALAASALDRILAVDVTSPTAVPPFANSQMDGYAVLAADLRDATPAAPVTLTVGPTSAAGDPVGVHVPGTATPVMTGAPLPAGADAVVPIEAADPPRFVGIGAGRHDAPDGTVVSFSRPVESGAFVREAGADLGAGSIVLAAGTRLGPVQLGSLAAAGVVHAMVRPRPVVLLISTGHELRAPGEALESGQIYDANTASLSAAIHDAGARAISIVTPDDAVAVREAVVRHPEADLVVTTGGVSAGAFEVVRDALETLGVRFAPIAMQPGGPQGLGIARIPSLSGDRVVPVVAFPGNPVSALLSFEMFLRPVLREAAGLAPLRRRERAPLAHALSSPAAKHQVRRGIQRQDGTVDVGAPGSHLLHDYARASVLVHVPIGTGVLPPGAEVEVWRIDE